MNLFFPDLNVWLALSVASHRHSPEAWRWMEGASAEARLIFSRYTQIGLLRLLTNTAVMGEQTLSLGKAWEVYDRWLGDPRIVFYPEGRGLEARFRQATEPFRERAAAKWIGDCWLLASAAGAEAALVTFDRALHAYAQAQGYAAVMPSAPAS